MIDDRENVLLVFLRFENQGQDNSQEHKEGAKTETNIIWTEEIKLRWTCPLPIARQMQI